MRYSLLLFFSFCCLHLSAQSFRFPEVDSRIYPISAHLIGDIISGELKMDKLPELTAPYPRYAVRHPPGRPLPDRHPLRRNGRLRLL